MTFNIPCAKYFDTHESQRRVFPFNFPQLKELKAPGYYFAYYTQCILCIIIYTTKKKFASHTSQKSLLIVLMWDLHIMYEENKCNARMAEPKILVETKLHELKQ